MQDLPTCQDCGKEFKTEAALAQHVKDKHGLEAGQAPKQGGSRTPRVVRRQKSLRKRNRHPVAITLVAVAIAAGVGVYFVVAPIFEGPPFPTLTGENWIHVHPYLVIDIAGRNVTIPANVGLVEGGTAFEPVHTHDTSGLLHVELSQSDAKSHNYTLGEFFTIWNYTARTVGGAQKPTLNGKILPVEFSPTDILGFRTNSTYHVVLIVDGKNCATTTATPCPPSSASWGSLNLEQLDYCAPGTSTTICATDLNSNGTVGSPYWDGTTNYPYGTGHTIVIEYVRG